MWSSNGDLNAGKGAKTSAFYPPLLRTTNLDGYSSIDPAGLVTGAGIGALQTIVGQPKATVYLIAPHGTVDIGDAGVRSTGDLNIAALRVVNADNIKVGGTVTGVPLQQGVTGALTTETKNNAAADAVKDATQAAPNERPSIIIVEVLGYGGDGREEDMQRRQDEERDRRSDGQRQDPSSRYHVVGAGVVTEEEARQLADEKRKLIGR